MEEETKTLVFMQEKRINDFLEKHGYERIDGRVKNTNSKWPQNKKMKLYLKNGSTIKVVGGDPEILKGLAMSEEYVEIDLEVIWATEEALLLSDGDKEDWIPGSQIEDFYFNKKEYEKGTTHTFSIREWQLKDKGFI